MCTLYDPTAKNLHYPFNVYSNFFAVLDVSRGGGDNHSVMHLAISEW